MNRLVKIALALLALGAFLLLPAALGAVIYVVGMGGPAAAACMPNPSFLATCIKGTYVLVSTALGGIVWASAIVIGIVGYIVKQTRK